MIRAKFYVESVTKTAYNELVVMNAVSGKAGESPENNGFAKATPSGQLKMAIDNPAAQGFFEPGKEYYLDFNEAPK